jgi:hypothetical protein
MPCSVILAADFTLAGDRGLRLALEIRWLAAAGHDVALAHLATTGGGQRVHPEVLACVRRGQARAVAPDALPPAPEMIVHGPARLDLLSTLPWPEGLRRVRAVCYGRADLAAAARARPPRRVRVHLHPAHPWAAPARPAAAHPPEAPWLPLLPEPPHTAPLRPVATYAIAPGPAPDALLAAPPSGLAAVSLVPQADDPGADAALAQTVSLDRCLAAADALVVPDDCAPDRLPDCLVAAFLAAGRPVIAPARLRRHYGAGLHYTTRGRTASDLLQALAGSAATPPVVADFVARCRDAASRMPAPPRRHPRPPAPATERPILFLPSNGVGLGHLTRLLAIARRMPVPSVFASQATAIDVIHQFGFSAEYLPSAALVQGDFRTWDAWFRDDLDRIIDRHDPRLVVYDGNNPSPGLIGAVATRPDCRLVWVRRGMWANTTSPHLDNARWFDRIVEPGELAAALDTGVTAGRRHEAAQVGPIRLLDDGELLSRRDAAAALSLDPTRPAVLVQLGSGYNRDLLSLLERIVGTLSARPNLQIAVAEWSNSAAPLTLWPQVTLLRGFPLGRYLRAFDFCISAAGYNAYHELIQAGMPTVFIANRHPTMDDQQGRAKFAQASAAAFEMSEDDLDDLGEVVAMLMQKPAREFLSGNCRALARDNGAGAAAREILRAAGEVRA